MSLSATTVTQFLTHAAQKCYCKAKLSLEQYYMKVLQPMGRKTFREVLYMQILHGLVKKAMATTADTAMNKRCVGSSGLVEGDPCGHLGMIGETLGSLAKPFLVGFLQVRASSSLGPFLYP